MFLRPLGVLFGLLGLSWEPLGACWGDLGPSWGEIGWSWGDFWVTSIFDYFLERFWEQKGCPKGGILGAKMDPKLIPKRGRNLRAQKLPLGSDLGPVWLVCGVVWKGKNQVENEDEKIALLGASWVDFGTFGGACWNEKTIIFY